MYMLSEQLDIAASCVLTFDLAHNVQGAVVNASVTFEGSNTTLSLSGWSLLKGKSI